METYYDTVLNAATGQPAPGITVKVFSSGTEVLAPEVSINSDGSTYDNPLTTDAYGFYQFYAPDGYYDLGYFAGDVLLRRINDVHLLSGLVAWQPTGLVPVFVDADEFTVSGDRTSLFFVGQRVRALLDPSTYVYGTVSAAVFGVTDTTVTLTGLTDPLTDDLAAVDVGIGDPNKAIDFSTISVTFPLVGPLGAQLDLSGVDAEVGADPTQPLGIATKQYVDAVSTALGAVASDLADLTGVVGALNGANLGTGEGEVFVDRVGNTFRFRSLKAGPNVTISQDGTEITIEASGGTGLVDGDYGDVTVSGGGTVITINNSVITLAKMATIGNFKVLGTQGDGVIVGLDLGIGVGIGSGALTANELLGSSTPSGDKTFDIDDFNTLCKYTGAGPATFLCGTDEIPEGFVCVVHIAPGAGQVTFTGTGLVSKGSNFKSDGAGSVISITRPAGASVFISGDLTT